MEVYGITRNAAKSGIRPLQRISHTKSRNGCYTCKQRRVKCDEERPTCGSCSVRGENCVFPNPGGTRNPRRQPNISRERSSFNSVQPHAQESENITNLSFRPLHFNVVSSEKLQNVDSQSTSSLNMNDLYLLQHFILHTSKKMTLHKSKTATWEQIIPKMAATHEFLMHLVLALAGLDILTGGGETYARNDPFIAANANPLQSIMAHHQQGLAGLQEALCVTGEPDAEALLAGSMLVAGFAFASFGIKDLESTVHEFQDTSSSEPISQSSLLSTGTLHIQWLQLVRGVTSILGQFWPTLRKCRLRALFFFDHANEDWKLCEAQVRSGMIPNRKIHSGRLRNFATGANHAVSKLRELYGSLRVRVTTGFDEVTEGSLSNGTPLSDQSGNVGNVSLDPYLKVIDMVEDLYMRILFIMHMQPLDCHASSDLELQTDLEDAAIVGWPHLLPEEFISSLSPQENSGTAQGVSLVILAHLYLTIAILDEIWYYGRRCDIEIYKINALIGGLGDEKLISLIKWPVDVIQG